VIGPVYRVDAVVGVVPLVVKKNVAFEVVPEIVTVCGPE
jgi:hypothetical protein